MNSPTDLLLIVAEYGLTGVALWMLYDIANNHLKAMQAELVKIRVQLEELTKKL